MHILALAIFHILSSWSTMAAVAPVRADRFSTVTSSTPHHLSVSSIHAARVLDRLESQLEEEEKSGVYDQWTRAGLAIAVANASHQLDTLSLSQTKQPSSSSYGSVQLFV
jgi:hypothetical protein